MEENSQSRALRGTIMAGVLGSAATALFFLMKDRNSRKKILASLDNAWDRLSKLETVENIAQTSPVKRVIDSISSVAGVTVKNANNSKTKKK